jgi:hypothetical protein
MPPAVEVPGFASVDLGLPAVDVGLDDAGGEDVARAASVDVERFVSAAESVASGVFAVEALPDLELDVTFGRGPASVTPDVTVPAAEAAALDFDFSPGFALPAADALPDLGGFGVPGAFDLETGDANGALDDDDLQLPPGVRLIAPVEATPVPVARAEFDLTDEVFAAPPASAAASWPDVPSFDLGLDRGAVEPCFGDLAAALESAAGEPAARSRDWAIEQSPNWDPASLAPPPEPVLPAPGVPHVTEWVDELRRSSVWIPTGDTHTEPDPMRPDRGLSMELESVIDSFREQMSRALDGDGSARYDLGVAYYDMGLYNEALAEFEAAAQSPGLEVQSFEMLAQCLLQTVRHAEVLDLLLPVVAADGHAPRGKVSLHYCLGLAYEGLGDFAQARRHYEEVALVDVDFKDVQTRLQRT